MRTHACEHLRHAKDFTTSRFHFKACCGRDCNATQNNTVLEISDGTWSATGVVRSDVPMLKCQHTLIENSDIVRITRRWPGPSDMRVRPHVRTPAKRLMLADIAACSLLLNMQRLSESACATTE